MYSKQFQTVLDEFTRSPAFADLHIGRLQEARFIYQFERYFSIQRIYALRGSEGQKRVYVKLYKNAYQKSDERFCQAIQRDFETNLFWYKNLAPLENFSTIKPLFLSLQNRAIITEEASGKNLGVLVRSQLRFRPSPETRDLLNNYMKKAGQLLSIIQQFEVPQKPFDLQELVEDVDARMRDMVKIPGSHFRPPFRDRVLAFYRANLERANRQKIHISYLHRDFMMGNLLVNGKEIVVHDFSKIDVGPALLDVTRFYHNLELLKYKPIYSHAQVRQLQKSFLEGYGQAYQPGDLIFRFFLLRHYMTHFKGLVKETDVSMKSRLYNRWVIKKHLENIKKIISA